MIKIILLGWQEGLEKVSLTKLQVEILGKSLKESKSNVDFLLDGKEVIIIVDSLDSALDFVDNASKIGAKCKVLLE